MTDEDRRIAERRTMALRGPGAGGFTPPQSLAASNPCLNCGTNIQLTYCPECGQAEIDSDPTLREFLHELAEEFLHWDGKLVKTFRLLVTRPGELTREYLAGRRVRFISPLRVYLSCSLLFFLINALVPRAPSVIVKGAAAPTRIGAVSIGAIDTTAAIAAFDTLARHGRWVGRVWGKRFGAAMRDRARLRADIAAAIPKTMFVLVPLFAAMVMLVFRRSRRRFPQHLAFALHVHAFLFLVLSITLARRFSSVIALNATIQLVGLCAFAVYLVRSVRTVYEVSTVSAIGRSALVMSAYFVAFVAAMAVTGGLVLLFQF